METTYIPAALSIAGSDSGGGAGIQADLKAFAHCGVHGMTAITAITAQSTIEVDRVDLVDPKMVFDQIATAGGDIKIDAIKIGMVGSAETVEWILTGLILVYIEPAPVVLDPVMVSESGAVLLDDDTREALVGRLLPRVEVVTPNIPEARALSGAGDTESQSELARRVHDLGPKAVVVTGGHSEDLVDVFFDGENMVEIHGEKHPGGSAHGSGCTHSSALAAFLAHGDTPLEAACKARTVASEAVANGLREIGSGPGPVDALGVRGRGRDVAPAATTPILTRSAR